MLTVKELNISMYMERARRSTMSGAQSLPYSFRELGCDIMHRLTGGKRYLDLQLDPLIKKMDAGGFWIPQMCSNVHPAVYLQIAAADWTCKTKKIRRKADA